MSAHPRSEPTPRELEIIDDLAHLRWGPTGFCCPHCQHDLAWKVNCRPRVRKCRRCRRWTSVTSGTLLHRTHLPLEVWVQRGHQHATSVRIPTTTELTLQFGVARSTAWLLNQKM